VAGVAGFVSNHPPRIPHELPLLPVVDGAFQPVGNVVVFAIPDILPFIAVCDPVAVDTLTACEEALNGPLLIAVLAV